MRGRSKKAAVTARRGAARASLSVFEDTHGPRESVAAKISNNQLNPKQETLVRLLLDPARAGDSIASLAYDAGVTPEEVLSLFKKGAVAEAHAISTGLLAESLPAVTQAVLNRAVDRELPCNCVRIGVADPKCSKCRGTGVWLQEADTERQKMVWDSLGLSPKKSGGVNIDISQKMGVALGGGFMDKFVRDTDSIAYNVKPTDIIDAEPEK